MIATLAVTPVFAADAPNAPGIPKCDHIFVIVEEDRGFNDVIGKLAAPNLNALAQQLGLATNHSGLHIRTSQTTSRCSVATPSGSPVIQLL